MEDNFEDVLNKLKNVFGIVGICPVVRKEDKGFEQLKKDFEVLYRGDNMYQR